MKSAVMHSRAIVSSRGQVVIPKPMRKELGIHTGTELVFEIRHHGTLTIKPTQRRIEMLFGCCKNNTSSTIKSSQQMDDDIMRAVSESDHRRHAK